MRQSLLIFSFLIAVPVAALADVISMPVNAYIGSDAPAIEVVAAFRLQRKTDDGTPISGISALAWDADEQLLYAVTDRGRLHHLRLIEDSKGTPQAVERIASYKLRDRKGKKLKGKWRDAESLFLFNADNGKQGDTRLAIGFEQWPRIVRYRSNGYQSGRYQLPKELNDKKKFHRPNDMFEALTRHPQHGVLVIPQRPLKKRSVNALYRIRDGKAWDYQIADEPGNSLASLETLPDGSLLVMERAWSGLWYPLVITLRHVRIDGDKLEVTRIARLSSAEGWYLDNFEGLTHLADNRFVIVSDDNQKTVQQTLLYVIELDLPE